MLILLLLKAGDIEMNPGSDTINSSLSILHSNIRSIRNKFDYITENFLDFDIYTQTEVKHHPNIISEKFFVCKFLQKNNQFVTFCCPSLFLVRWTYQNAF